MVGFADYQLLNVGCRVISHFSFSLLITHYSLLIWHSFIAAGDHSTFHIPHSTFNIGLKQSGVDVLPRLVGLAQTLLLVLGAQHNHLELHHLARLRVA